MKKFTVEMCYGLNVSVEVEALNQEDAIQVAREMVDCEIHEYADINDLEYEETTYIKEHEE